MCRSFPSSRSADWSLIWQSGVQRGQREIAYLCVCVCVPVLSDDPSHYPAKLRNMVAGNFSMLPKCGYKNTAQHGPSRWRGCIDKVPSRRTIPLMWPNSSGSVRQFLSPNLQNRNTKDTYYCTINILLHSKNNTWNVKIKYFVAVSQESETFRDSMSLGLAGLFSTVTEGLKAHRIWVALILECRLILHVALTTYLIVHEG